MFNLFCFDKDRVEDKVYCMLLLLLFVLIFFVCYMFEFIIYCGLEELLIYLGVLLGVLVLFGLFDMCDLFICKNMVILSSYL